MQTAEVTQGQWAAVVTEAEILGFLNPGDLNKTPSYFSDCGSNCPVEQVSWNDIQIFIGAINKLGDGTYRLPTEAEWEYAARTGSTTAFFSGNITVTDCSYDANLDTMGWYCYSSANTTHDVAKKDANAWGLYDMHGNVSEWVQDWYGDYEIPADPDPTGATSDSFRVYRGGSWSGSSSLCRSSDRNRDNPYYIFSDLGFRLLWTH